MANSWYFTINVLYPVLKPASLTQTNFTKTKFIHLFLFNLDQRCVLIYDALPCSDIEKKFNDVSDKLISGGGDYLL